MIALAKASSLRSCCRTNGVGAADSAAAGVPSHGQSMEREEISAMLSRTTGIMATISFLTARTGSHTGADSTQADGWIARELGDLRKNPSPTQFRDWDLLSSCFQTQRFPVRNGEEDRNLLLDFDSSHQFPLFSSQGHHSDPVPRRGEHS